MAKQKTRRDYIVTVRIRSDNGDRPIVRTLGGDTVFISLAEGQIAEWTLKRAPKDAPKLRNVRM